MQGGGDWDGTWVIWSDGGEAGASDMLLPPQSSLVILPRAWNVLSD